MPTVRAHSHFLQLALPLQRSWLLQLLLPVPLQLALPLQRTWLLQRSRTCSRSLNLPLELPMQRTWLINVCDPGARTLSQDPQSGPSVRTLNPLSIQDLLRSLDLPVQRSRTCSRRMLLPLRSMSCYLILFLDPVT